MEKATLNLNVNVSNLTEEERKTLMSLIEKSNKTSKIWMPREGESYYVIDDSVPTISERQHLNTEFLAYRLSIGNVFRTKEEAEFELEKLKVYTELKNYALEHNDRELWKDKQWNKYIIIYNYNSNDIEVTSIVWTKDICQIYFSSNEIAKDAIKSVGEDRIKKYLFNIL